MKKIITICFSFISLQILAQTATISGVTPYSWYNGCGPTSVGMVMGYYDTHDFPDLFPGNGADQNAIQDYIASPGHINDYAYPIDDLTPTILPDNSEILPPNQRHPDDCIADYMRTSQSLYGNRYGWSLPGDITVAWENYISNKAPDYVGVAQQYSFGSFPWDSLVSNIDRNHPMVFLVDFNGDGYYDHYVTIIGYSIQAGVKYYGCLDTWVEPVQWYEYREMLEGVAGRPWGVLDCYTFDIYKKLPADAGPISGLTNICKNQTGVVYTVPSIANATSYVWAYPAGASGGSSTNSISLDFGAGAVSGNITVKGRNANGDGLPSSLAITVTPLPSAAGSISGSTTVCQGQSSVNYSVPSIPNATSYVWTLPSGATGTSTTNSISVSYGSTASSGNITVKGTNCSGNGTQSTLAITVNPLPGTAGAISGNTTVCQGQSSVVYSVAAISNATSYTWSLPSGATGTSTTNSISVSYGATATSGNITVKGTNSCGNGTQSALAITVNPLPAAAGTITGITNVCQGQSSVVYSVATIANASSYIWSLPSGATGSSTTNSISVNYGASAASGNISVRGTNSCGDGTPSTLAITVNVLPSAAGTISGITTVCQGQTSVTYTVPSITNATTCSLSVLIVR